MSRASTPRRVTDVLAAQPANIMDDMAYLRTLSAKYPTPPSLKGVTWKSGVVSRPTQTAETAYSPSRFDRDGPIANTGGGKMKSVKGLVLHHTGGGGDVGAVVDALTNRTAKGTAVGATYVMDRDGTVYRIVPEGARTNHAGNYNASMEGIEVIAKDDSDITPEQIEGFRQFAEWHASSNGYEIGPKTILGHGEVSSKKRQTEGATLKWTLLQSEGFEVPDDAMVGDDGKGNPGMRFAEAPAWVRRPPGEIPETAVATETDTQPTAPTPMPSRPFGNTVPQSPIPSNAMNGVDAAITDKLDAMIPGLRGTAFYDKQAGATRPQGFDPAAMTFGDSQWRTDPGVGSLLDPRTAALLAPNNVADQMGSGPQSWFPSKPLPITPPSMADQRAEQNATRPPPIPSGPPLPIPRPNIAPTPMPGRPMDAAPPPMRTAPTPMPGRPLAALTPPPMPTAPLPVPMGALTAGGGASAGTGARGMGGLAGMAGAAVSPPPVAGNLFDTLGSGFSFLKDKAVEVGAGLNTAAAQAGDALATTANNAVDAILPEAMKSLKLRTAFIDPIVARAFTSKPGYSISDVPTKYGDTFQQRQMAAMIRQALQEGRAVPAGGLAAPAQRTAPRLARSSTVAVPSSIADRRSRQIAEGKASQLDQFGMIR